ncbi:uncharacterized protein EV154DRAFT_579016 [Mucor mucedo]|uniref:uncharacterized protein n=1 Tax=Mucor mucedo TaxID=29922 RepID=UPI00222001F5|nr:uncharacterized protein EV154DRAFT_579016 [Mucor mucedo]KAI7873468.1 hypothetical protein EV154DRAFT_579016 [Mucor mucedo]
MSDLKNLLQEHANIQKISFSKKGLPYNFEKIIDKIEETFSQQAFEMTPRLARQFFTLWYHTALRDYIATSQDGRYCTFLKCFSDDYEITATDVQIEIIMTAFDTIEPDTEALLKALDILVLEKWDIWVLSVTEDRVNEIHIKDFLVIINPENPTGQCLSTKYVRRIAMTLNYILLQVPKKKVLMGFSENIKLQQNAELVSFHLISKGLIGECGRCGGFFECVHLDNHALEHIYKLASVTICPNIHGQIMVDLMHDPPHEGQVSYPLYQSEIASIYNSLKRHSKKLETVLNQMEGVSCEPTQGAMLLFPRIIFPVEVLEAAKNQGEVPDTYYALAMLEATSVCVVLRFGSGQKIGTWHIRLPEEHLFDQF